MFAHPLFFFLLHHSHLINIQRIDGKGFLRVALVDIVCPPADFRFRIDQSFCLGVIVYRLHVFRILQRFERSELFLVYVKPHHPFVSGYQHTVVIYRRKVVTRSHRYFPILYLYERRCFCVPVLQFVLPQLLVA